MARGAFGRGLVKLKYRIRMLGQTGRLSERQRVKPRLTLLLIRIRYFVVSLIPWSEALSRPPSPQNLCRNRLFSGFFKTEVNEYIAAEGSRRGRETFAIKSPQAAPFLRLSACLGNDTSDWKCAGSGADGWSTLSGEGDSSEM